MAANTIDPDHQMTPEFELPGFRFHPTEEELLEFYLKSMVFGKRLRFDIIGFLNIYHHDPWDLPGLSKIGEREWYFFVPRDRKHGSGGRPNRTTETGFWKATGSDRKIVSLSNPKRIIGLRKTLVFYKGRAPRGSKTDWVMNEYRLPDNCQYLKDIVLCKIYRKATSLKVLEQMAAIEGDQIKNFHASPNSSPPPTSTVKNLHASPNSSPPPTSMDTISFCSQALQEDLNPQISTNHVVFKQEIEDAALVIAQEQKDENAMEIKGSPPPPPPPPPMYNLPELQVPKFSMDWTQDTVWTQMNSPWLQNMTPLANILNF